MRFVNKQNALALFFQLLQFQRAGLFTIGAAAKPCAQLHHSLTEKHLRRVRTHSNAHIVMVMISSSLIKLSIRVAPGPAADLTTHRNVKTVCFQHICIKFHRTDTVLENKSQGPMAK